MSTVFPSVRSCHSALILVGQEPGPSQATDMALACCFLSKVLEVGYHYFPPPLEIPTFAARYLHVCTTREILVAKGAIMGENIIGNLAEMTTSTPFCDLLHAARYDMGPMALLPLRRKAC